MCRIVMTFRRKKKSAACASILNFGIDSDNYMYNMDKQKSVIFIMSLGMQIFYHL